MTPSEVLVAKLLEQDKNLSDLEEAMDARVAQLAGNPPVPVLIFAQVHANAIRGAGADVACKSIFDGEPFDQAVESASRAYVAKLNELAGAPCGWQAPKDGE